MQNVTVETESIAENQTAIPPKTGNSFGIGFMLVLFISGAVAVVVNVKNKRKRLVGR